MALLFLIISQTMAMTASPMPFPVFLKEGFSTILEFEMAPTQVVLGDQTLFQVERLNKSIVIKPLASDVTTNLFVYFKSKETRLFLLKSSEEFEPTFYKRFNSIAPKPALKPTIPKVKRYSHGAHLLSASFDRKRDFLTVEFIVVASTERIAPAWERARLNYRDSGANPSKVWSERREVQRDSSVKARMIFTKPDIPGDLKNVNLVLPTGDSKKDLVFELKGGAR